jgi:hypothetical protein
MRRRDVVTAVALAATLATVARSGHELPVYPSYYPHEIEIESVAPERAAELLRGAKIHAYVGPGLRFAGELPDGIGAVASLGSFVVVRVNPASPRAKDEAAACALAQAIVRDLAGRGGELIFHPYPVTPLHGDYLHHVDLAEAASARLLATPAEPARRDLKVRAEGALAKGLVRSEWQGGGPEWDAAVAEVSAADLVAAATVAMNGWLGPSWLRTGWFQAHRLLAATGHSATGRQIDLDFERLQTGGLERAEDRIDLERDFVGSLAANCYGTVAGYTLKREYINTEFSAGIENVAYDAVEGLHSPLFLRTVKLKDFPWNGWLVLGTEARPDAAWNPIAGFTDKFGRLAWFALGDPAVVPSPYESAWMLNRISDVQSGPAR